MVGQERRLGRVRAHADGGGRVTASRARPAPTHTNDLTTNTTRPLDNLDVAARKPARSNELTCAAWSCCSSDRCAASTDEFSRWGGGAPPISAFAAAVTAACTCSALGTPRVAAPVLLDAPVLAVGAALGAADPAPGVPASGGATQMLWPASRTTVRHLW